MGVFEELKAKLGNKGESSPSKPKTTTSSGGNNHKSTPAEEVKAEAVTSPTSNGNGTTITTNPEEAHAQPAPPALTSRSTTTTADGADENASMIPLGKGGVTATPLGGASTPTANTITDDLTKGTHVIPDEKLASGKSEIDTTKLLQNLENCEKGREGADFTDAAAEKAAADERGRQEVERVIQRFPSVKSVIGSMRRISTSGPPKADAGTGIADGPADSALVDGNATKEIGSSTEPPAAETSAAPGATSETAGAHPHQTSEATPGMAVHDTSAPVNPEEPTDPAVTQAATSLTPLDGQDKETEPAGKEVISEEQVLSEGPTSGNTAAVDSTEPAFMDSSNIDNADSRNAEPASLGTVDNTADGTDSHLEKQAAAPVSEGEASIVPDADHSHDRAVESQPEDATETATDLPATNGSHAEHLGGEDVGAGAEGILAPVAADSEREAVAGEAGANGVSDGDASKFASAEESAAASQLVSDAPQAPAQSQSRARANSLAAQLSKEIEERAKAAREGREYTGPGSSTWIKAGSRPSEGAADQAEGGAAPEQSAFKEEFGASGAMTPLSATRSRATSNASASGNRVSYNESGLNRSPSTGLTRSSSTGKSGGFAGLFRRRSRRVSEVPVAPPIQEASGPATEATPVSDDQHPATATAPVDPDAVGGEPAKMESDDLTAGAGDAHDRDEAEALQETSINEEVIAPLSPVGEETGEGRAHEGLQELSEPLEGEPVFVTAADAEGYTEDADAQDAQHAGDDGVEQQADEEATREGEPVEAPATSGANRVSLPASAAYGSGSGAPVKQRKSGRWSSLFRSRSKKERPPTYYEQTPATHSAHDAAVQTGEDGGLNGNAATGLHDDDEHHEHNRDAEDAEELHQQPEEEVEPEPEPEPEPDNRPIFEIAASTPLPAPTYTPKTLARHEKERKKREYEEMVERERRRREREMLEKRERILAAYTGRQDFSSVPTPKRTKPFGNKKEIELDTIQHIVKPDKASVAEFNGPRSRGSSFTSSAAAPRSPTSPKSPKSPLGQFSSSGGLADRQRSGSVTSKPLSLNGTAGAAGASPTSPTSPARRKKKRQSVTSAAIESKAIASANNTKTGAGSGSRAGEGTSAAAGGPTHSEVFVNGEGPVPEAPVTGPSLTRKRSVKEKLLRQNEDGEEPAQEYNPGLGRRRSFKEKLLRQNEDDIEA